MSATNILDRFREDYEGGHPVEYALPPSPKKLKEIEKVMGGVSRTVRDNAKRAEKSFTERLPRFNMGEAELARARNAVQGFMDEIYNDPKGFALAIERGNLEKVMKDGSFKNQFQTNTSKGVRNLQRRAKQTNRNFGTPIEETTLVNPYTWKDERGIDPTTRALKGSEKYGYHPKYTPGENVLHYGEYTINFNPANVRDRVTFTNGDSLGNDKYPVLVGDKETWGGAVNHLSDNKDVFRIVPIDENAFLRLESDLKNPFTYNELQFHGPLGLDDVESITIPRWEMDALQERIDEARWLWPERLPPWARDGVIPERWMDQADANRFNFVDENGNILYQWGCRK